MSSRQKIIDTMYHLLGKKGYDKTSIGLICSEIGISKPAVYYYFKSKEEILVAIFDETINDGTYLDRFFPKQVHTKEDYIAQLHNAGTLIIEDIKKDLDYHSVLCEMYVQSRRIPIVSEKIQEYASTLQRFLVRILKQGVELSAFPTSFDVNKNAEILNILMQGIENSIGLNFPINCVRVWEESINRMFLECRV